ncbi:MAG TPA: tRNA guanosine(34) transglycosylase Tgt [Planctomycetota bacterium]|nr:tRNA guanosine(34) transglycosylase Tgt [Planctomycetota bacterium]
MTGPLAFEVVARDGAARTGRLTLPHGVVETPTFMAVGTRGAVKACTIDQVLATGTPIVLGNTYHLALRPGAEIVKKAGGLHKFTGWTRNMLTDSGGFQVWSLSELRKVSERGVEFRSHYDGALLELTPERSIQIQNDLGADIIMAFDECSPYPCPEDVAAAAVARTSRWAERSRAAHKRDDQALFGIVQGSTYLPLREESARALVGLEFPGYAIGGLSVGEGHEKMDEVLAHTCPLLPEEKPRYLMGVGTPRDFLLACARGVDLFDCVLPTRNARNAQVFTATGHLKLRNARFREDFTPIDPECLCYACKNGFSRAYLRHLFNVDEITALTLATIHNLTFCQDFMKKIREAISRGELASFARDRNVL